VAAPQAIVDGFDLRLSPVVTAPPINDGLLIASPRLGVTPAPPAVATPPAATPGATANPPATGAPKPPVPLAQADVGAPALDTQVSIGLGAGSCTAVQLTLLDVGTCPAPPGSGPLNLRLGGSLLGGG
jgi:hypothetical protein